MCGNKKNVMGMGIKTTFSNIKIVREAMKFYVR